MLRRFMKSNSKATNRDNARVSKSLDTYHSSSLRHYCGRLVENENYCNPCGLCDGRCGPDNGCQCKACDELDKEIERRGDILGSRNFVNEAARPVHVSFSIDSHDPIGHYRFYCGANVGRNNYPVPCDECDGRCGPDNGCQCVACNELEAILESVELSRGLNSVQIEVPSIDQNIISSSDGIGSKSIDNFDTEISPQYYLEKKIQNLTSLADCENMSQILNSLQNKLSAKKVRIIDDCFELFNFFNLG